MAGLNETSRRSSAGRWARSRSRDELESSCGARSENGEACQSRAPAARRADMEHPERTFPRSLSVFRAASGRTAATDGPLRLGPTSAYRTSSSLPSAGSVWGSWSPRAPSVPRVAKEGERKRKRERTTPLMLASLSVPRRCAASKSGCRSGTRMAVSLRLSDRRPPAADCSARAVFCETRVEPLPTEQSAREGPSRSAEPRCSRRGASMEERGRRTASSGAPDWAFCGGRRRPRRPRRWTGQ